MSSMCDTYEKGRPTDPGRQVAEDGGMTLSLVLLLATGAGLAVASIYYSQPMLGLLAAAMGSQAQGIGLVPTLTQLGYAAGILLLAPLGDRHDRRRIILIKSGLLAVALLGCGLAPSLNLLLAASLAIGLLATLAQDIVPAAVVLAPASRRGRIVGMVMTGLLLGILLSRVVSGLLAEYLGWRSVFLLAAGAVLLFGAAAWRWLPAFPVSSSLSYRALLASLLALFRQHGALRRAVLAQGLLSVAFSAFWATLALMLEGAPFHLGSSVAGAFGLAGAAGALAAPLAGQWADRRGPARVTQAGTLVCALSFALLGLQPWLTPQQQLWLLGLAIVGFDLGIQATLIAHQSIVYGIDPEARSRLNAVLVVGMFVGMAAGSALGSVLQAHWGWMAVVLLATLSSLLAFAVRLAGSGGRRA